MLKRRLLRLVSPDLLGTSETYSQKVLSYSPIAYWPLWEASGTTAENLVSAAMNGTYARDVSVMGTGAGIGDGNTAPFFDGANDSIGIFSAALQASFNGNEGTLMAWARVVNADIWSDGTARAIVRCPHTDFDNAIALERHTVVGRIRNSRIAAGAAINSDHNGLSFTDWFHVALTWSITNNQVNTYINAGVPVTTAGPANWVGATLNVNLNSIGATNWTVPNQIWHGWIAHVVLFDEALDAASIADLVTA